MMLTWEDSYPLARILSIQHVDVSLEEVSLEMIYRWVIALPEFEDAPELANYEILHAIYQEWFEEANPL